MSSTTFSQLDIGPQPAANQGTGLSAPGTFRMRYNAGLTQAQISVNGGAFAAIGGGTVDFLTVPDGTVANPGLGFASAPTTGLSRVGGAVVVSQAGVEAARFTATVSTFNGSVAVQTDASFFFETTSSGMIHLGTGLGFASDAGTQQLKIDNTGIGFFATAPVAKPTVTGLKGSNAALASLLTGLAALGLVTDSSGV